MSDAPASESTTEPEPEAPTSGVVAKPSTEPTGDATPEPKAEAADAEAPKAEAPKADAPKAEAPKADALEAEAPKAEAPKAEAPRADRLEAEATKADATKAEATKAEPTKAEATKPEATKADATRAEATKAAKPDPRIAAVERLVGRNQWAEVLAELAPDGKGIDDLPPGLALVYGVALKESDAKGTDADRRVIGAIAALVGVSRDSPLALVLGKRLTRRRGLAAAPAPSRGVSAAVLVGGLAIGLAVGWLITFYLM